jgi:hypothetical protein
MIKREIKIENRNNVLATDGFVVITFIEKESVPESDLLNMQYTCPLLPEGVTLKIIDFLRVDFKDLCSLMTLPATALEAYDFKMEWLQKYPKTEPRTKMAVYYYKKVYP